MATDPPETRKMHITRIFGVNKKGERLEDLWVDVERIDIAKSKTQMSTGHSQGLQRKFRWCDDPNSDDYDPDGTPSRSTEILKVCDPETQDPDDPDEWVPVRIIKGMRARVETGTEDNGGTAQDRFLASVDSELTTARTVEVRKIIHYDTNIDDAAEAAFKAGQDAFVFPREEYQRDDSTKDKSQYIEQEVILSLKQRGYRNDVMGQKRQTRLLNQYLIDGSETPERKVTGGSGYNPPYRLDPYQNIINVQLGAYDNRIVFAIGNDGNETDQNPSVYTSTNGWDWIRQTSASSAYVGDASFINLGGYRRDTKMFVVSGVKSVFDGVFFINTNIDMASADGIRWAHNGANVDASLLYAYSEKARKRDVNGFVYRVAGGDVSNAEKIWNVVDDKRFKEPKYARHRARFVQRCDDLAAKEDDNAQPWQNVLVADTRYIDFGPLTVIKGDGPNDVPTVVCVAITPTGSPNKFAILSSVDGAKFIKTFNGPPVVSGGSDIVSFCSGRVTK
ncbi:hypothetical protein ACVIHI_005785 [Bradyrhizobium sp. USDA 4524]|uniref:hypothetical protein n=1 Tax=unclassified Bradyrhizobium TaxID=2631580 RepID=UPI0020A05506|nr:MULTISPECIES: hypothetical protein [unclassified Bradyrhizobium]MCP1841294.1 hypothetical protein [Bradyrhizobium sp. USDA 4538]MCP1901857.1 hypothetical protein [Bradyrhizobium sp. USDA 4537]MCP1992486.1 hypothetical protein [Bradyrhizobium sp. USDA 4539]